MSAKTLLSLVPACLLLCACASGGAKTEVSPLVGKYQAGETVAIFNPDGTFEGTTTQNETWVRGTTPWTATRSRWTTPGNRTGCSSRWGNPAWAPRADTVGPWKAMSWSPP